MASTRGNQLWKLRNKHNREILFDSPRLLLQSAYEYFEWCDKHTYHKQEAVKSGPSLGTIIQVPVTRPYSVNGLCTYLNCSTKYYYRFKQKCNEEFTEVIERIETIIETQQFEGAVIGTFNTTALARMTNTDNINENDAEISENTFKIEVCDTQTKVELEKLREKLKKQ